MDIHNRLEYAYNAGCVLITLTSSDFATYMGETPGASTTPTSTEIDAFITNFESDCDTVHGTHNDCATRRAVILFINYAKNMEYNEGAESGEMHYASNKFLMDEIVVKCLAAGQSSTVNLSFNLRTN